MASRARLESNALLRQWCRAVTGHVLSIGSGQDQDGEGRRYREYFSQAASYTTSEYEADRGCDRQLDVRAMPEIATGAYDAVFCSGVLEHVDDYQAGVRECHRVLTPGGVYLVGVPFRQAIHMAPQDFWRFTEHGLRYALQSAGFSVEALVGVDATNVAFPAAYWARARKGGLA